MKDAYAQLLVPRLARGQGRPKWCQYTIIAALWICGDHRAWAAIVSIDSTAPNSMLTRLGIGTTAPAAGLDVALTGSASAVIVPRDTTANRPVPAVNGMLRYATDVGRFEIFRVGAWENLSTGAAGGGSLSTLTGATAPTAIDSGAYPQTWTWSTATTQAVFNWAADALTTGSLLSVTSASSSFNSSAGLLSVVNSGTSQSGVVVNLQANSASGSGMTLLANGRVGIGTIAPAGALDLRGQLRTASSTGGSQNNAATSVDWNNGNAQSMSIACTTSTFTNMLDGGAYTLAVTDTTTSMCTFSHAGLTFVYSPSNTNRVSGQPTVYSFQRIGNTVYTSWIAGFQ